MQLQVLKLWLKLSTQLSSTSYSLLLQEINCDHSILYHAPLLIITIKIQIKHCPHPTIHYHLINVGDEIFNGFFPILYMICYIR